VHTKNSKTDESVEELPDQWWHRVYLAVVATTISLVIIFVPIAFMTGYARRYVNQFGWTMAFSVMVSMLVCFTLTPMLSSRMLKRRLSQWNGPTFGPG